jgi:hypothetical protein
VVKAQNETKAASDGEKTFEQTSKPVESVKDEAPAATSTESKEELNGTREPQPGDKRSLDDEKATVPSTDEASKKQKTEEEKPSPADFSTAPDAVKDSTANGKGEKRKLGRPKKGVKDIVKKLTPRSAEGIGSRTRSQAKLSG